MSFFFGNPYTASRSVPVYYSRQPARPQSYYYQDQDDDDEDIAEDFCAPQPFTRRPTHDRQAAFLEMQRRKQEQQRLEQERIMELKRRQQLEQERIMELKRRQQLLELQRQQELKRRMELQQKRQEEEQAAREAILLKRRVAFLRYTHAAKVIQRAFRTHLSQLKEERAKVLAVKREQAAFIVQRTLRAFKLQQEAKRVVKKLRSLAEIRSQVEGFRSQYEEKVLSKPVFENGAAIPNKDYLIYEDSLLKALIKLDGVLSEGSEVVREARKSVISRAQKLLTRIDEHKKDVVPMELEKKQEEHKSQADIETPTKSETEIENPNTADVTSTNEAEANGLKDEIETDTTEIETDTTEIETETTEIETETTEIETETTEIETETTEIETETTEIETETTEIETETTERIEIETETKPSEETPKLHEMEIVDETPAEHVEEILSVETGVVVEAPSEEEWVEVATEES